MSFWNDVFNPFVNANLIILDPPFGINFDGKPSNYNRKKINVVDGYREWSLERYKDKIIECLDITHRNLSPFGSALIFSGWNNSNIIHNQINNHKLHLQGKLYWGYNFILPCKKKPGHNVYEIFFVTKHKRKWFYNNRCEFNHCNDQVEKLKCPNCHEKFAKIRDQEANLSVLSIKRDYKKNTPKYSTMLPIELIQVLLSHFSKERDLVFDFLSGSGIVGIACKKMNREFLLSDINKNGKVVYSELLKYYSEV